MKKCSCGKTYSLVPKQAKLFIDDKLSGYYYNCSCGSTIFFQCNFNSKLKILTNLVMFSFVVMILSACGGGSSGGSTSVGASPVDNIVPPDQGDTGNQNPEPTQQEPQTYDLTYYAKSFTEAPVNGWINKQYTATGYCAQVSSKTYCWDDGVKTLDWTSQNVHYGPLKYTYFSIMTNVTGSGPLSCHGGCANDYFITPTLITQQLNTMIGATISDVLNHGDQGQVTCTINGSDLVCGSVTLSGAYQ